MLMFLNYMMGLKVVKIPSRGVREGEPPATSGVCQVRGRCWVLLAVGESPVARSEVLAHALREHCADALEQRYLPPAVRDLLGS